MNRTAFEDPLAFRMSTMNDESMDFRLRVHAAKVLLAHMHPNAPMLGVMAH